uniref:Uncharacterized protein n=1 Tax=Setaria digitata TaxID=48799 RepID=A0A915Q459_9BILA
MHKDETERYNYWKNRSLAMESFIVSKSNRKLSLIALLNLWQKLLEPHVKIVDFSTAKRYSRGVADDGLAIEKNTASATAISIPTVTSSIAGYGSKGFNENHTMKQFDILLLAFFWPIFKTYSIQLGKNKKGNVQLFLLLDTITVDATFTYNVVMDNRNLNIVKAFAIGSMEMLFPRIEMFYTQPVLLLLSDLSYCLAYCIAVTTTVTSTDCSDDTQNSITNPAMISDDGNKIQQKWIKTILNLIREYRMNTEMWNQIYGQTMNEEKLNTAKFSLTINGNIIISAIKVETKIMDFILLLRIFNSKIRYNNVYFMIDPKDANQQVTFAIQDIKMMITEKGTLDTNAIFRGSFTTIISTFRRIYEANNLQNAVNLSIENMKLNYIIGSSFVLKRHSNEGQTDDEENDKKIIPSSVSGLDQAINTDVLNMLLYSHETVIAEIAHIMEIVRSSATFNAEKSDISPFLFHLQICCENVSPWLKITLTDTTNTAFRITSEAVNLFLIGRNILNDDIFENQIRGSISFCLNFKLGQMIRNEAYQEDELRELADLTTNLICIFKISPKNVPDATIIFSRTVILFKFPAIIRAKNILKDFNFSRSFWMEQKMHPTISAENDSEQLSSHSSLLLVADNLAMKITLLFHDRIIVCIPLYSNNYRSFTSALLFGLKDAQGTVKLIHGAKIEAKFTDFKIVYVENFELSMEESWINGQENTPTNFTFFPLGVCKIAIRKVKSSKTERCKRAASAQFSMKGLLFDIDSRIGSLMGALRNTHAAINEDQDVDVSDYEPMKIVISEVERDDDINPKNEYASIVKPEKRIRWVEQKVENLYYYY